MRPQTDLAHDSVHAAQRAAEKEAAKKAAEAKKAAVPGRLLDSGVAKASDAKDTAEVPLRPTMNSHVHRHNPDGAPPARRSALRRATASSAAQI